MSSSPKAFTVRELIHELLSGEYAMDTPVLIKTYEQTRGELLDILSRVSRNGDAVQLESSTHVMHSDRLRKI